MTASLLDIFSLQVDAFTEEHADLAFSIERVKMLQVMTSTLAAIDKLVKNMDSADETDGFGPGDIVEFRRRLARQLDALGQGEGGEEMGGAP